jgi:hypothetical protein
MTSDDDNLIAPIIGEYSLLYSCEKIMQGFSIRFG